MDALLCTPLCLPHWSLVIKLRPSFWFTYIVYAFQWSPLLPCFDLCPALQLYVPYLVPPCTRPIPTWLFPHSPPLGHRLTPASHTLPLNPCLFTPALHPRPYPLPLTPCLTTSFTFVQEACAQYHNAEAAADLSALNQLCQSQGSRFPLLAARAALRDMQLNTGPQQAHEGEAGAVAGGKAEAAAGAGTAAGGGTAAGAGAGAKSGAAAGAEVEVGPPNTVVSPTVLRGGLGDLQFLCHATVPLPHPEPWVQEHSLLHQGLQAAAVAGWGMGGQQGSSQASTPNGRAGTAQHSSSTPTALEALSIDWCAQISPSANTSWSHTLRLAQSLIYLVALPSRQVTVQASLNLPGQRQNCLGVLKFDPQLIIQSTIEIGNPSC